MPDLFLLITQLHVLQKYLQVADRQLRHFKDILICYSDRQRGLFQTLSLTQRALTDIHEFLIFLFHGLRMSLTIAAVHIGDQSLKTDIINAFTALPLIMHRHSAVKSIDELMAYLLRQVLVRRIQRKSVFLCQCNQDRMRETLFVGC